MQVWVRIYEYTLFFPFPDKTVDGESILGTKKRRIIMLSDMLLCVSLIKGYE